MPAHEPPQYVRRDVSHDVDESFAVANLSVTSCTGRVSFARKRSDATDLVDRSGGPVCGGCGQGGGSQKKGTEGKGGEHWKERRLTLGEVVVRETASKVAPLWPLSLSAKRGCLASSSCLYSDVSLAELTTRSRRFKDAIRV